MKEKLEEALIIGTKIRIGRESSKDCGIPEGEVIELIEGYFENDNGLYTTTETCPAIWNERQKDFDSIYHLFGNDLEYFVDSEIITQH